MLFSIFLAQQLCHCVRQKGQDLSASSMKAESGAANQSHPQKSRSNHTFEDDGLCKQRAASDENTQ